MVSRLSVEGNAKTRERSMEIPPDDSNGLRCWYYTIGEPLLTSKQTHLICPRAIVSDEKGQLRVSLVFKRVFL
jgi:hypothetical protein